MSILDEPMGWLAVLGGAIILAALVGLIKHVRRPRSGGGADGPVIAADGASRSEAAGSEGGDGGGGGGD